MLKRSQIKLITLFINKIKDNLTNINYMIKKYQKEKLVVKMNLITNFSFKDSLKQEIVVLQKLSLLIILIYKIINRTFIIFIL